MVIRLFFYVPDTRRRVRRLCLAARRTAWYNTCSFWKGGHGCLRFITLQGVCHVDKKTGRRGVLQMPGETEPDYIAALTQDYTRAQEQLAGLPGEVLPVFTYPFGAYSELSERVLQELGVQVTVTTEGGANRLVKGEPETLRLLHRIHVWRGTKPDMLLSRIDGALQALR